MQKKPVEKEAVKVAVKDVVKATESKAAVKAEEVKAVVKETETAAKTVAKKAETAAAKTVETVAKKAEPAMKKAGTAVRKVAKKTTTAVKKELVPEVYMQFDGNEAVVADIVGKAKDAFIADGHKSSTIKSLRVYLKPEEYAAYYVVNEKYAGKIDLF